MRRSFHTSSHFPLGEGIKIGEQPASDGLRKFQAHIQKALQNSTGIRRRGVSWIYQQSALVFLLARWKIRSLPPASETAHTCCERDSGRGRKETPCLCSGAVGTPTTLLSRSVGWVSTIQQLWTAIARTTHTHTHTPVTIQRKTKKTRTHAEARYICSFSSTQSADVVPR